MDTRTHLLRLTGDTGEFVETHWQTMSDKDDCVLVVMTRKDADMAVWRQHIRSQDPAAVEVDSTKELMFMLVDVDDRTILSYGAKLSEVRKQWKNTDKSVIMALRESEYAGMVQKQVREFRASMSANSMVGVLYCDTRPILFYEEHAKKQADAKANSCVDDNGIANK